MSDSDRMPKIDKTKLSQFEKDFIKAVEQQNLQRVQKLQILKRKNLLTGSLLGVGVLAIYGYSIFSVKQEHFLDDFEVPTTTTSN